MIIKELFAGSHDENGLHSDWLRSCEDEDDKPDLQAAYISMAADEASEKEALEWAEATIADVSDAAENHATHR